MTDLRIILCSCAGGAEAERIARRLVELKLAACVQILPQIHSIYRWQEKVVSGTEALLLVKTSHAHVERARECIQALHTYEIPELLVLEVAASNESYLSWLAASLQ